MRLILEETSFKFNNRHMVLLWEQKWQSLFPSYIWRTLKNGCLRSAHTNLDLVWKRFIDDTSPCGSLLLKQKFNLPSLTHSIPLLTCEMSPENAVFLDTEVFKGPRFSTLKFLDVRTHFKQTETFPYTHFSCCHPINTKRGFIKGESLRLLKTNSIKANFEKFKRDFEVRLYSRGYPDTLVRNTLATIQFSDKTTAIRPKKKEMSSYRSLQPTTRLNRISKGFSWNIGTGFKVNQTFLPFSNNLRLYLTKRKDP